MSGDTGRHQIPYWSVTTPVVLKLHPVLHCWSPQQCNQLTGQLMNMLPKNRTCNRARKLLYVSLSLEAGVISAGTAHAQWTVTGKSVPQLAVFDNAMQTIMANHNIPNGKMAVTYQGRLVLARGYTRNPGTGDIGDLFGEWLPVVFRAGFD